MEKYIDQVSPALDDFSTDVRDSLTNYTRGLESDLNAYSRQIQKNIDQRLKSIRTRVILSKPDSSTYQRIDTNTGVFLISYQKKEALKDKTRLHFNIGNPNYADYRDFKIKIFWGAPWDTKDNAIAYEVWQNSLKGIEFTFQGMLYRGTWNSIEVDLPVTRPAEMEYMECELDVLSVELQVMKESEK